MPSDFSYLPPASHALQFIVCYQQFTITMYFSPLLISLPYSSMRVTSGDGNSLILLKLFILCFVFRGQFNSVHHSSALHVVKAWFTYTVRPHTKRIPQKTVNSFIFVFFEGAKTPLQRFPLAYKSTAAVCVRLIYKADRFSGR